MTRTICEEVTYNGDVKIINRLYEDNSLILKVETKKISHNWCSLRYRLATIEDHARMTIARLEALSTRFPH